MLRLYAHNLSAVGQPCLLKSVSRTPKKRQNESWTKNKRTLCAPVGERTSHWRPQLRRFFFFFFRQWKWKKDEGWVVRGGVPTDNVFCKKKKKFSHHLPEHSVGMHINFPSHTTQKNEILRRKKKSNKREMNLQNKKTQGFYNLKKMRRRQSIDSGHYRLKKESSVDTSNTKVKAKRSENKSRSTLCNGPSNPLMKLKREGAYSSLRAYQGLGAERWQMKRVRRWHWRSLTHSSPDKKEKWKELGLIKWLFPLFFFLSIYLMIEKDWPAGIRVQHADVAWLTTRRVVSFGQGKLLQKIRRKMWMPSKLKDPHEL